MIQYFKKDGRKEQSASGRRTYTERRCAWDSAVSVSILKLNGEIKTPRIPLE